MHQYHPYEISSIVMTKDVTRQKHIEEDLDKEKKDILTKAVKTVFTQVLTKVLLQKKVLQPS